MTLSGHKVLARIVAIGMSNTDLVCRTHGFPRAGETVAGIDLSTFAGGKGANQAVAAARAGSLVSFYGATGDDAYGEARRSDLQVEGIDIGAVQIVTGTASGVALIVVDDSW
jgi:ribokinase